MYDQFASVYDMFIDTDYGKIADFYLEIFKKTGIAPALVLDLGCGTGTLTNEMARRGIDVFGADISREMLAEAKAKYPDIMFINQDMRELDLYGTCSVIYSSLDCLNYILKDDEMRNVFSLCHNFLDAGGAFIFDISTPYKLAEVNGDNTFVLEKENCFGVWENEFENGLLNMTLNFFVAAGKDSYTRFEEYQTQRAWKREEILKYAGEAGFAVFGVYDGFTFKNAGDGSVRETYVLIK